MSDRALSVLSVCAAGFQRTENNPHDILLYEDDQSLRAANIPIPHNGIVCLSYSYISWCPIWCTCFYSDAYLLFSEPCNRKNMV